MTEVQKKFLELENILDGVYGVGELVKQYWTKYHPTVNCFPHIYFMKLLDLIIKSEYVDSRKIIFTKIKRQQPYYRL